MPKQRESMVNLRIPRELSMKIDWAVKSRPLPTSRHAWIMEALYGQVRKEAIEGRLQISRESEVGPQYSIGFLPYIDVAYGGALRTINVVGDDVFEGYLRELDVEPVAAKNWVKILKTRKTISIDHVTMSVSWLGPFGFSSNLDC
jgi:hypothetical protein